MNNSRFIPETPDIYRQVSEQNRVYLFNVGPWKHVREMGSAGTFIMYPCPEGKEYSEPLALNGVVEEPYPISEAQCTVLTTTGTALAEQIMGIGPHTSPNSSLVPFGVFMDTSEVPSKQKLAEAKRRLSEKYLEFVREANEAYAQGPAGRSIINPDYHFVAARKLRKTAAECRWLEDSEAPAERSNCPGCGEIYTKGILRHGCGWFFDKAKWEANQAGK
jgi:hypothetical protein